MNGFDWSLPIPMGGVWQEISGPQAVVQRHFMQLSKMK